MVKADDILWWAVLRSARPVPDPVGIFFHQVLHFNSPFLEIVIRLKKNGVKVRKTLSELNPLLLIGIIKIKKNKINHNKHTWELVVSEPFITMRGVCDLSGLRNKQKNKIHLISQKKTHTTQ